MPLEWTKLQRGEASAAKAEAAVPSLTSEDGALLGKEIGHYRVLQVIGGGSMAVVYKAEDLKLGRLVALKILPEELGQNEKARLRFEHDARVASALNHPNICPVYEVGEHDGRPFIVMPMLEGQTLREQIAARAAPFSTDELLHFAIQIASGLDAAHEKGIIHRDVKPANVFITNRGEAKILDFGLARLVRTGGVLSVLVILQEPQSLGQSSSLGADTSKASLTLTGATMGAASYLSPEQVRQVRRQPLDARTDLFSFGAVLYEMATGRQPFFADSTEAIQDSILNQTPPSPLLLNPDLPRGLEAIIARALEKDRDKRYQSAAQVITDLWRLPRDSSSKADELPIAPQSSAAPAPKPSALSSRAGSSSIANQWLQVQTFPRKWNRMTVVLTAILIAAGALGAVLYRWTSHPSQPSIEGIQITKLTDGGKAEDVAISPDGGYVAYLSRDGDETSLHLRQVREQGEAQVPVQQAQLFPGLAFSPDGSHLYFLRATPQDPLHKDLYEIATLGDQERKVMDNIDSAISFSPDGQQFVYERGVAQSYSVEIRIANADGSGDRLLVSLQGVFAEDAPGAAWSPDGKSIVVPAWIHSQRPRSALYIISAAEGTVRELYSGNQELGRPRWLSDGNMLVVPISDQTGHSQLWTVSYPAGEARRLTNDLADYDADIDTTRDGRILATVQRNAISNLWVSSPPDASNGKPLTSGEQMITSAFPVDGKLVIINRANNGVWVLDSEGTHPKLIADATRASWFTACGRSILFVRDRKLMQMDSDGANVHSVATGSMWGETCSPDGKFVYYPEMLTPRWKIRRVSIDGGVPLDILENPGAPIPGRAAISPDGRMLAFPYDVALLRIGVILSDGGPLVASFDVAGKIDGLRWSPDGKGLQYLLDKNGATNLWEQPISGGPPRQVTKFTAGRILDFSWSADGKQLLLSRSEVSSDIVLLSNIH